MRWVLAVWGFVADRFRAALHFWVRREACKLAALAFQNFACDDSAQHLWSLAVFFETYMHEGAEGTAEDFGPKEPVELRAVNED